MGKEENCDIIVMCRDDSLKQASITGRLLKRNWTDCKYNVVLCTETSVPHAGFFDQVVFVGKDKVWSDRLDITLKRLSSKYVILLLEDFFIESVDEVKLKKCIGMMDKKDIGAIFLASPPPFTGRHKNGLIDIPKSAIYRIAIQPILYNRKYLMRFTADHLSPWQFERKASAKSSKMSERILALEEPVIKWTHAWSHGAWRKEAIKVMVENDIEKNLYCDDKIYPWYLILKENFFMILLRIAPHLITNIRIKQFESK